MLTCVRLRCNSDDNPQQAKQVHAKDEKAADVAAAPQAGQPVARKSSFRSRPSRTSITPLGTPQNSNDGSVS